MKKLLIPALVTLAFNASANTTDAVTISLKADIPDSTFYVRPSQPISGVQEMNYNIASETLDTLNYQFAYKKPTDNKIEARLTKDAILSNGVDSIDLTVTFDGKEVTHTSDLEIKSKTDAATGLLKLAITPASATGKVGQFYGDVDLAFVASLVP
ncbi:CS1 type fimbrial major subunit [Vibrio maritimus]|uniref:CS1 type fimbrial major subunit n=1 Tax=Vibrio maritimus TaxID=990268 RepID=UPI0040677F8C